MKKLFNKGPVTKFTLLVGLFILSVTAISILGIPKAHAYGVANPPIYNDLPYQSNQVRQWIYDYDHNIPEQNVGANPAYNPNQYLLPIWYSTYNDPTNYQSTYNSQNTNNQVSFGMKNIHMQFNRVVYAYHSIVDSQYPGSCTGPPQVPNGESSPSCLWPYDALPNSQAQSDNLQSYQFISSLSASSGCFSTVNSNQCNTNLAGRGMLVSYHNNTRLWGNQSDNAPASTDFYYVPVPGGSLNQSVTVTFNLSFFGVNHYHATSGSNYDSNYYCVATGSTFQLGPNPSSSQVYNAAISAGCQETTASFQIVFQIPTYSNIDTANCNQSWSNGTAPGINGWALDLSFPKTPIYIAATINAPYGSPGSVADPNWYYTDVLRQDVNASFNYPNINPGYGVTGNHGFSINPLNPSDQTLYNYAVSGNPFKVYLYAKYYYNKPPPTPLTNPDSSPPTPILFNGGQDYITIQCPKQTPQSPVTLSCSAVPANPVVGQQFNINMMLAYTYSSGSSPPLNIISHPSPRTSIGVGSAGGTGSGPTTTGGGSTGTSPPEYITGQMTLNIDGQAPIYNQGINQQITGSGQITRTASTIENSANLYTAHVTFNGAFSGSYNASINTSANCTFQEVYHPYFKVFGGDVASGVSSQSIVYCYLPNQGIDAWNNGGNGDQGSGTTTAALATGNINGFASGQNILNMLDPLTMANSSSGLYGYGGNLFTSTSNTTSSSTGCNTSNDYYNLAEDMLKNSSQLSTASSGFCGQLSNTEKIVLQPYQHFICASEGSFNINASIYYPTNITSVSQIPSLEVVTKGNIYINPNVTNLAGTYIAEGPPGSTTTGIINDMGNGGYVYCPGTTNTTVACNEHQLVIDGSFIANQLDLYRTYGNISNASNSSTFNGNSHAAEVFNYSPLNWLVPGNPNSLNVQSITSLPPVL